MKADNYYFDVNWEVCARSGESFLIYRGRIRSALRVIDRYYYLAGPDLKSRPEFAEPDDEWRGLVDVMFAADKNSTGPDPGRETGWRIPGEPQAVFANFGRRMNSKFHLYELWEDSGLVITNNGRACLEPVMYSHASRAIIDLVAGPGNSPDFFFGTGRLCVKRKTPEPETVLNSVASFEGRTNYSGHVNIYFEAKRPSADTRDGEGAVLRAGALPGGFAVLAAAGVSPLSPGPAAIGSKGPAVVLSIAGMEDPGSAPALRRSVNFFTRTKQCEGNSLSSILWILAT